MSDLIERLRAILLPCSTCDGTGTVWAPTSGPDPEDLGICHNCNGKGAVKHPVTAEAAAELARLTAEVERLRADAELWRAHKAKLAEMQELKRRATAAIKEAGNGTQ